MTRSLASPSLKRKRPETNPLGLIDSERAILNAIKIRKENGISRKHIKQEISLTNHAFDKSLESLLTKKLIKEVVNIQAKGKHYMAIEFKPKKEMTGGEWYVDGNLDKELIDILKRLFLRFMRSHKVATLDGIHKNLKKSGVVNFEISSQQVAEILNLMVLENDIIEVKSTGLGEYHSIPIGTTCYRVASGLGAAKGLRLGAFASIPCGTCPRISMCAPIGVVSPMTCVYYTKWLELNF